MPYDAIPNELKQLTQWVGWKYVLKEDKVKATKVPIDLNTGKSASVIDASSWVDFHTAIAKLSAYSLDGLGFVFSANDVYCGIDLDATDDPQEIVHQQFIANTFGSYQELSPSGQGLHIIVKAKVPLNNGGVRRSNVECYSAGRFFTMTGNARPGYSGAIEDRQQLVNELVAAIGKERDRKTVYMSDCPQRDDDAAIIARIQGAANAGKIMGLINGDPLSIGGMDKSGSAIDLAIVNVLQFYTQNVEQIERLWRSTPHAQSRAHKMKRGDYIARTIQLAFDRDVRTVDIDMGAILSAGRANMVVGVAPDVLPAPAAAIASGMGLGQETTPEDGASPVARPARSHKKQVRATVNPFQTPPPGLIGEIAQFIYSQAPSPIQEIAVAGAIGLMAGIAGRAFNYSGNGLNLYMALVASSGIGKEAISSAWGKISRNVAGVDRYIGVGDFSSSQGFMRYLKEKPSSVSLFGEFGKWCGQVEQDSSGGHRKGLQRTLLDIYAKSDAGNIHRGQGYAKKEDNIAAVSAPAFTLLGETTPSTFYPQVTASSLADGFIPRFIIVEYDGDKPFRNENSHYVKMDESLILKLATLVQVCNDLNDHYMEPPPTNIAQKSFTPGPLELAHTYDIQEEIKAFSKYCTVEYNKCKGNDAKQNIWSRLWVNTSKLAALCAVGVDCRNPIINGVCWYWAKAITLWSHNKMLDKLSSGELPVGNLDEQYDATLLAQLSKIGKKDFTKYGITPDMAAARVFNANWLNKWVRQMGAFHKTDRDASLMVQRALARAIQLNQVRECALTGLFGPDADLSGKDIVGRQLYRITPGFTMVADDE